MFIFQMTSKDIDLGRNERRESYDKNKAAQVKLAQFEISCRQATDEARRVLDPKKPDFEKLQTLHAKFTELYKQYRAIFPDLNLPWAEKKLINAYETATKEYNRLSENLEKILEQTPGWVESQPMKYASWVQYGLEQFISYKGVPQEKTLNSLKWNIKELVKYLESLRPDYLKGTNLPKLLVYAKALDDQLNKWNNLNPDQAANYIKNMQAIVSELKRVEQNIADANLPRFQQLPRVQELPQHELVFNPANLLFGLNNFKVLTYVPMFETDAQGNLKLDKEGNPSPRSLFGISHDYNPFEVWFSRAGTTDDNVVTFAKDVFMRGRMAYRTWDEIYLRNMMGQDVPWHQYVFATGLTILDMVGPAVLVNGSRIAKGTETGVRTIPKYSIKTLFGFKNAVTKGAQEIVEQTPKILHKNAFTFIKGEGSETIAKILEKDGYIILSKDNALLKIGENGLEQVGIDASKVMIATGKVGGILSKIKGVPYYVIDKSGNIMKASWDDVAKKIVVDEGKLTIAWSSAKDIVKKGTGKLKELDETISKTSEFSAKIKSGTSYDIMQTGFTEGRQLINSSPNIFGYGLGGMHALTDGFVGATGITFQSAGIGFKSAGLGTLKGAWTLGKASLYPLKASNFYLWEGPFGNEFFRTLLQFPTLKNNLIGDSEDFNKGNKKTLRNVTPKKSPLPSGLSQRNNIPVPQGENNAGAFGNQRQEEQVFTLDATTWGTYKNAVVKEAKFIALIDAMPPEQRNTILAGVNGASEGKIEKAKTIFSKAIEKFNGQNYFNASDLEATTRADKLAITQLINAFIGCIDESISK